VVLNLSVNYLLNAQLFLDRNFLRAIACDLFWTRPICTPILRQGLSVLSLQVAYDVYDIYSETWYFWVLCSYILEMLEDQVRDDNSHSVKCSLINS